MSTTVSTQIAYKNKTVDIVSKLNFVNQITNLDNKDKPIALFTLLSCIIPFFYYGKGCKLQQTHMNITSGIIVILVCGFVYLISVLELNKVSKTLQLSYFTLFTVYIVFYVAYLFLQTLKNKTITRRFGCFNSSNYNKKDKYVRTSKFLGSLSIVSVPLVFFSYFMMDRKRLFIILSGVSLLFAILKYFILYRLHNILTVQTTDG